MKKLKLVFLILAAFFLFLPLSIQNTRLVNACEVNDDLAPEPWLLEPVSETVDLIGKDTLTFKWSPFQGTLLLRKCYDFRLYKGYQTLESTQVLKKIVDPKVYAVVLDANLFEDGQVYTWTLRQIYCDIRKSDAAYNSFRVIKKGQ